MYKKIIVTVSFILISLYGIAQKDINNYKYIIVPKSFEFSKSEDQYQLNSLLKFLFNKYGYEAYFGNDELPEDLKNDRCLALSSQVLKLKGGMFKTKLEIILKDCFGNMVITSQIGESREKEFSKAYNLALRDAFETFQNLDYKYVTEAVTEKVIVKETPKENHPGKEIIKVEKKKEAVLAEVDKNEKGVEVIKEQTDNLKSDLYYAQASDNGFQLVNSEPRIVMVLLTTAAENVFIVKGKSAIVFKEDGFWYYSENNGKLSEQIAMNIKF